MKNEMNFSQLSAEESMKVNGGSFAYDVGRILRFIGLSGGGSPMGLANAISDWQLNAMINEIENP